MSKNLLEDLSIKAQLNWARQQLQLNSDTARLDAEVILADVLAKNRSYLFAWSDRLLDVTQSALFEKRIQRRLAGEPVAYILGWQEFWSMPFKVNAATLIPRPETEQLVDAVLEHFPADEPLQVWDAGTGSGAIAVALASEKRQWHLMASDYSADALVMAAINASINLKGRSNIAFVQADWLESVAVSSLDILLSNPPYIREDDEHLLALAYEPESALIAQDNGLADYKKLLQQARICLKPGASIYLEHGYDQRLAVADILIEQGFVDIVCVQDYAGNDRFSYAKNGLNND